MSNITGEAERRIREMLLFVARSLVDHPNQIEIVLTSDSEGSIFRIHAHPRDVANLTGNRGHIARALSCVIVGSGKKIGRRLTIDIVQETSRR